MKVNLMRKLWKAPIAKAVGVSCTIRSANKIYKKAIRKLSKQKKE
jgi:hypothetical protein